MSVRRNADRATSPVKHFFFLSRSRCGPSGEHTCTWCFEMPVRVRRRNSDERIHGPHREYYSWCCVKVLFLEFVFTTGTWSRSRCGPSGEHTHAHGASRCPCACVGEILISALMDRVGNTIPGVVLRCFSWNLFSPLVRGLQSIRTCP